MLSHKYETLIHWLHFFLIVAAVCATLFPAMYFWVPWYKSALGRVLMLHAVALALALDVTVAFTYWTKYNVTLAIWINFFVFGAIAFANVSFVVILVRTQWNRRKHVDEEFDGTMVVETTNSGGKKVTLEFDADPYDLDQKNAVTFKVKSTQEV